MMSNTQKKRLDWVDAAKGMSILLVALYHIGLYLEHAAFSARFIVAINTLLLPIRMPVFFVASGIFARSAINKEWGIVARDRVAFYFYLFLVWSLIRFAFFGFVTPNTRNFSEGSDLLWLVKSFLIPETGAWFLWALGLFFLVTKALRGVNPRYVLVAAATVSMLGYSGSLGVAFTHENLFKYFFFFYGACYCREALEQLQKTPVLSTFLGGCLFALLSVIAYKSQSYWIDGPALFISAIASVCAVSTICFLVQETVVSRSFAYLGSHTLPIYVVHVMVVVSCISIAIAAEWPRSEFWTVVLCGLTLALAIGVPLLVERLMDFLGLSRFLFRLPTGRKLPTVGQVHRA